MDVTELLANCEKEALHLSGQIQSFGALLLLDEESQTVTHASANIEAYVEKDLEQLLGANFDVLEWLREDMLARLPQEPGQRITFYDYVVGPHICHIRLIRGEGAVVVELEQATTPQSFTSYQALEAKLYPEPDEQWQETDYFDNLLTTLHEVLPYRRLMLYRFESDWVGEVVAESVSDGEQDYLGLKFPASDIPAIARQMYFQNPSRMIPDVTAAAVDIVALKDSPVADLTWSDLRSVSPVHLQYLQNMDVGASYSIALIIGGKLWGIVACHHPCAVTMDVTSRQTAEKLVKQFCTLYNTYRSKTRLALLRNIEQRVDEMVRVLSGQDSVTSCQFLADILVYELSASSTALLLNGTWYQSGRTVDEAVLNQLDRQVKNDFSDYIFQTNNITQDYGDEFGHPAVRGVLAIKPNFETGSLRCYAFRVPEAQYIQWAGNPEKSQQKTNESGVLTPRLSFEKWTETRGEASREWTKENVLLAKKVRAVILREAGSFLLS
ncbi:GAF domain-containing protein [Salinimonas sediminis]|uniref:GAF domain-containing protein n=1 Tax=Salinimonas sediminis TaxID=2303538 RepID=A0A346NII6_9ALTE|nr:GAF domain-containing protein [Salinimonas sediminis]AXR05343.1 GAF domain-containing protein [Salinimonas sediminis]